MKNKIDIEYFNQESQINIVKIIPKDKINEYKNDCRGSLNYSVFRFDKTIEIMFTKIGKIIKKENKGNNLSEI